MSAPAPSAPYLTSAKAWAFWALVGIGPFIVYVLTLCPTVGAGDAGELTVAAYTLGVAHAPGYPLFTMLGKLFSVLPVGNVAYRLNLMSAFFDALAVLFVAAAIRACTCSAWAALIGAWALACSTVFWKYALVTEVFALNDLFAALLLWALAHGVQRWREGSRAGREWPLRVACFVTGIGMANHYTLLLLSLPVLAMLGGARLLPVGIRARLLPGLAVPDLGMHDAVWAMLCVAVGLLPLAYLPLAAAARPVLSWDDPRSLGNLLTLLSRDDYGSISLVPAQQFAADVPWASIFLRALPETFGGAGVATILVGLVALVASRSLRPIGAVVVGGTLLFAIFLHLVNFPAQPAYVGVVERYFIVAHVLLALVVGIGAHAMIRLTTARSSPLGGAVTAVAGLLLLVALPLTRRWERVSQRGNYFVEDLGRNVLDGVDEGGVLFAAGDLLVNATQYVQLVEGYRPDVVLLDQNRMSYDWYVADVRRRYPDLLPGFGRGDRFKLTDGSGGDGKILEERADEFVVLTPKKVTTIPKRDVASLERDLPAHILFLAFRPPPKQFLFRTLGDDRYSQQPDSMNLLWLDHLYPHHAVFVVGGLLEQSYAFRYTPVPWGLGNRMFPDGALPSTAEQLTAALDFLRRARLESYFRTYDATSMEIVNRPRYPMLVSRVVALLVEPEAAAFSPRAFPGYQVVLDFLQREAGGATPDPDALYELGLLYARNPHLRNDAKALAQLERYLALAPSGANAETARSLTDSLRKSTPAARQ